MGLGRAYITEKHLGRVELYAAWRFYGGQMIFILMFERKSYFITFKVLSHANKNMVNILRLLEF